MTIGQESMTPSVEGFKWLFHHMVQYAQGAGLLT